VFAVRLLLPALLIVSVLPVGLGAGAAPLGRPAPAHHAGHGFRNVSPDYAYPILKRAVRAADRLFEGPTDRGRPPAVLPNDGAALRANGTAPTITWVGHATFLVQIDGVHIVTDPIWSVRTGPVWFVGPRRLLPPGLRLEDLPPIHAVLISHDHYDHLDLPSVRRLAAEHRPTFFVPLGLRAWLKAEAGITEVVELDWWQTAAFRGLTIVCTPAQHSSGRTLHDQNRRLWSSWSVLGRQRRFFFAGDTGYYPGFREIGERLGPFDLAAIPIGGYSEWQSHPNHVNPEEAVQVFEDVRGRLMVPMHWGTFALNREPFQEPPDRLWREALRRGLEERIALLAPGETIHW
jgi:N-acyl-phosphatidylethanolamine-hydrolysing phospholipase D